MYLCLLFDCLFGRGQILILFPYPRLFFRKIIMAKTQNENAVLAFIDESQPEMAGKSDAEKFERAAELLRSQRQFGEAMGDIYNSEPELAQIITAVVKDRTPFIEALAKVLSPEELAEMYKNAGENASKTAGERSAAFRSYKEQQAVIEGNREKSIQNINAFVEEQDWTPEQEQAFFEFALGLFKVFEDGVIEKKELSWLVRLWKYDDNIAAAREEGITAGRNEKIDARRLEEEARKGGDGLPSVSGAGGAPPETEGRRLPKMVEDMLTLRRHGAGASAAGAAGAAGM